MQEDAQQMKGEGVKTYSTAGASWFLVGYAAVSEDLTKFFNQHEISFAARCGADTG